MNIFKKIFHGLDLRNNKIINAKTNKPEDSEHIANKEYVDLETTLDSEKAKKYRKPFTFEWMPDIFGWKYKKIFDELFYPRLLPEYTEPSIIAKILAIANTNNLVVDGGVKFLGFIGMQHNFVISYTWDTGDRIIGTNTVLKIIDYDGSYETFDSNTTGLSGSINVRTEIKPTDKVLLIKKFGRYSNIKKDTYNEDYIAPGFNADKEIEIDITEWCQSQVYFIDPILMHIGENTVIDNTQTFAKNKPCIMLFSFSENLDLENHNINIEVRRTNDNKLITGDYLVINNLGDILDTSVFNGLTYSKYSVDLGTFEDDVTVIFKIHKNKL